MSPVIAFFVGGASGALLMALFAAMRGKAGCEDCESLREALQVVWDAVAESKRISAKGDDQ